MERFYRSRRGWVDGTAEFHELCARAIECRGARILEVGPGPSNATSRFLATLGVLYGVDPDRDVLTNDALAQATVVAPGAPFPFEGAWFKGCVSNYVVEHVTDAEHHLAEVYRVLAPGGAYVLRTPNLLHYVSLVAAATPHWFHCAVANRLRVLPSGGHDPYPTVYKLNTRRAIERSAARTGFDVETLLFVEKQPSYGMCARPLFMALMGYERIVNSSDALAFLRANVFCVLRKRSASGVSVACDGGGRRVAGA